MVTLEEEVERVDLDNITRLNPYDHPVAVQQALEVMLEQGSPIVRKHNDRSDYIGTCVHEGGHVACMTLLDQSDVTNVDVNRAHLSLDGVRKVLGVSTTEVLDDTDLSSICCKGQVGNLTMETAFNCHISLAGYAAEQVLLGTGRQRFMNTLLTSRHRDEAEDSFYALAEIRELLVNSGVFSQQSIHSNVAEEIAHISSLHFFRELCNTFRVQNNNRILRATASCILQSPHIRPIPGMDTLHIFDRVGATTPSRSSAVKPSKLYEFTRQLKQLSVTEAIEKALETPLMN